MTWSRPSGFNKDAGDIMLSVQSVQKPKAFGEIFNEIFRCGSSKPLVQK